MRSTTGMVRLPGRHRLPLGKLVEDLIARAAHEIGVHQLRHHAPAFQRVSHGRAHDGRFGNRRVEEAMIRQRLGEAAIDARRRRPSRDSLRRTRSWWGRWRSGAAWLRKWRRARCSASIFGTWLAALEWRRADLAANLLHARILRQVCAKFGRAIVELLHVVVGEHHRRPPVRKPGRCAGWRPDRSPV